MVTAANVSDNEAGKALLTRVAADIPTISKAWVDSGYKVKAIEHGATLGIDVDVVPTPSQGRGFEVIPRRWPVERTFGWIMMHRRLARDYETKTEHSESMIRLAMIDNLARRATGESTITWRNLKPPLTDARRPLRPSRFAPSSLPATRKGELTYTPKMAKRVLRCRSGQYINPL